MKIPLINFTKTNLHKIIIIMLIVYFAVIMTTKCDLLQSKTGSCYRITDDGVFLRYYGGYPRAEEVLFEISEADKDTFYFLEGSRERDCQTGHMFAKDTNHVYYRNYIIENADIASFKYLQNGYSKDQNKVYYKEKIISDADPQSFIAINNEKLRPYGGDKNGAFYQDQRLNPIIDTYSFEILFPPYFKDKKHIYYGKEYQILEEADINTFICPKYEQIINYQYYCYDKNNAYYFENNHLEIIHNIDYETFLVFGFYYAKDKNKVYYKNQPIPDADSFTFYRPQKHNQELGKDINHDYFKGIIKKEEL